MPWSKIPSLSFFMSLFLYISFFVFFLSFFLSVCRLLCFLSFYLYLSLFFFLSCCLLISSYLSCWTALNKKCAILFSNFYPIIKPWYKTININFTWLYKTVSLKSLVHFLKIASILLKLDKTSWTYSILYWFKWTWLLGQSVVPCRGLKKYGAENSFSLFMMATLNIYCRLGKLTLSFYFFIWILMMKKIIHVASRFLITCWVT